MKRHMRQNEMLDMEEMAGSDVAAAPAELQRRSRAKVVTRSRSAPTAPTFGTPAPSSIVEGAADKQSLRVESAGEDKSGFLKEQLDSESVFDEMTIGDLVDDKQVLKRLEGRFDRMWGLHPTPDQSAERLTLARFRQALEQAGCDFRQWRSLRSQSQSSASEKKSEPDDLVTAKRVVNFIVAATPDQLIALRKLAGQFASMDRLDLALKSTSDVPQEEWAGFKLPRVNGLDPPGDRRIYLFMVFPENEPTAKP